MTVTPNEFTVGAVCFGHMTPREEDEPPGEEESTDGPTGTWVYDGYVCDNGGMCASSQKCPDGSVKKLYYFLSANGDRGETKAICPGDADIPPVQTVTPPTPGQIFTAFKKEAPTAAALAVQPPNGQTLVNFETVFSTTAVPFTTKPYELLPGFTIEFEIAPTGFTWTFGDGATLTTDSPGKAWEEGDDVSTLINHIYTSLEPVKASVTTTWGASVRLNGGPPIPVVGTVDKTSNEVPLEILEATPELVK